jgi:2-polyprenyl-3-methyl-5-hydroxy-6-metoxy-1,4-benzoquinol methylase
MHNTDTHFMARRDALLTRHEGHAEWLRLQEAVWRQRSADYGRLDWVGKQDFINKMIEFCGPQPDWTALDAGTGPGIIAAEVRKHADHVVGVDLSQEMIDAAVQKHGAVCGLSFAVGNIEELEFADDTFDLVTARMVFHHVGDVFRAGGSSSARASRRITSPASGTKRSSG